MTQQLEHLEEQSFMLRLHLARQIANLQIELLSMGDNAYSWRSLKNLKKTRDGINDTLGKLIPLLDRLEKLTNE